MISLHFLKHTAGRGPQKGGGLLAFSPLPGYNNPKQSFLHVEEALP